jgi:hypothetical protein
VRREGGVIEQTIGFLAALAFVETQHSTRVEAFILVEEMEAQPGTGAGSGPPELPRCVGARIPGPQPTETRIGLVG